MFLGVDCTPHGGAGTGTPNCCAGETAWAYDAKTGQPYTGFMCWNAQCAAEGQFAGPGGVGNKCCPPLVNTNGRCAKPSGSTVVFDWAAYRVDFLARLAAASCSEILTANNPFWAESNNHPYLDDSQRNILNQAYIDRAAYCQAGGGDGTSGGGQWISGISNTYVIAGVAGLGLLLMVMKKKKGGN